MKRFSSIFPLLFLALSCIYPYEVQETYGDSVNVVVDGSIVVGNQAVIHFMTAFYTSIRASVVCDNTIDYICIITEYTANGIITCSTSTCIR